MNPSTQTHKMESHHQLQNGVKEKKTLGVIITLGQSRFKNFTRWDNCQQFFKRVKQILDINGRK